MAPHAIRGSNEGGGWLERRIGCGGCQFTMHGIARYGYRRLDSDSFREVCDVVGMKPTNGRVSRFGAIPLAWSLDHVGPITKTVEDAAIMLSAIAGPDPNDPTASSKPVSDYRKAMMESVRGLRLGIPRQYFFDDIHSEIRQAVDKAILELESLGMATLEVYVPNLGNCAAMEAHIVRGQADKPETDKNLGSDPRQQTRNRGTNRSPCPLCFAMISRLVCVHVSVAQPLSSDIRVQRHIQCR